MFDPSTLIIASGVYLSLFFAVAWLAERGALPLALLRHRATYVFALGVVLSTWAFYTAFISADSRGYGFNAYYLGYSIAFLLSPFLLQPLLRITKRFQLASLADLFAFRFRSAWAGTLTTVVLLVCVLPLLAMQNLTLASSAVLLSPGLPSAWLTLGFLLFVLVFALRFGSSDVSGREPNAALLTGLAFEGAFKLLMLLLMGGFAVYAIFGGFGALQEWLNDQPPETTRLQLSFLEDSTNILILLFFTSAVAMPQVFHLLFHENRGPGDLRTASWAVPLYLLLASLPVLPILWANERLGGVGNPQFTALQLGLAAQAPAVTLLYFIGGLAAATGVSVVVAVALATMVMNHVLLRLRPPPVGVALYPWLLRRRRLLLGGILGLGYLLYLAIAGERALVNIGSISLIACLQFLPGLVTLLYWPAANAKGFIAGLLGGLLVWFLMGVLPYVSGRLGLDLPLLFVPMRWTEVGGASLLVNLSLLLLVSLTTSTAPEERQAARLCAQGNQLPVQGPLKIRSVTDFVKGLAAMLGEEAAEREVLQALQDLRLQQDESRPFALLQLRNRLEANLSALLGPSLANHLVETAVPLSGKSTTTSSEARRWLEQGLDAWPVNLTGIALDLDSLRRQYRQTLLNLPLGVCELDEGGHVVLWNGLMGRITGISGAAALGLRPATLPAPWGGLLDRFLRDPAAKQDRQPLTLDGKTRWLSLHKAFLQGGAGRAPSTGSSEQLLLVEDRTETILMENELAHTDRLNSIGRLAAGVAHEIGNPVTGIACLAQNLRDEYPQADIRELAEQILGQTRRIAFITEALLRFSHRGVATPALRPEMVDLHALTAEAFTLLRLGDNEQHVDLVNACCEGLSIKASYQPLLQVLLNLLTNAQQASAAGARIEVSSRQDGAQVRWQVTDEGCGIPASLLERVFDPFFTTKDPGQGTGLGLALVHRLVTDLGGSVRIESPPASGSNGKGTCVIVTFPCYDPGSFVTE